MVLFFSNIKITPQILHFAMILTLAAKNYSILKVYKIYIFYPWLDSPNGSRPPHRSFQITLRHTTLGRTLSNEWPTTRRSLHHHTLHIQETNIYAFDGIWTRNPSKRTAADPRLGPRGHWDRHISYPDFVKIYRLQKFEKSQTHMTYSNSTCPSQKPTCFSQKKRD
jgi:hypothetical protein